MSSSTRSDTVVVHVQQIDSICAFASLHRLRARVCVRSTRSRSFVRSRSSFVRSRRSTEKLQSTPLCSSSFKCPTRFPRQPFARAHCSTSRWPPRAARCKSLVPRSAVRARPLQHLQVAATAAWRKSTRPTERRSLAPTAASPGGRLAALAQVSRPTERRSRAPTAAPPGGRLPRLRRKSPHPTEQPFARAHCSTSRWPPIAASAQVLSSHGAPFARAHFSTSRWPPPRPRRKSTRPRSAVRARPLQHLQVAAYRSKVASSLVPRSAVRARPLQHLQVAASRGIGASHLVPRSAVRARPLQHLQVAVFRGEGASPLVPRTSVRSRPLQHLQVAAFRGIGASILVPRAAVRARPLQHLQVAALRGNAASPRVPRTPSLPSPTPTC